MRTLGLMTVVVLVGCASGGDERDTGAWEPTAGTAGEGSGTGDVSADGAEDKGEEAGVDGAVDGEEGEGGDEGVMPQCDPGAVEPCLCPDGLHLGEQACDANGFWATCEDCQGAGADDTGADTGGGEMGGGTDDGGTPMPQEVCYPGTDLSYTTCFPLHYFAAGAMPAGYEYPGMLGADVNYRDPVAFIDLEEAAADTQLSPNFVLSEIAQVVKGKWAIVQPHAVESLQALRDDVGAINVNSGYRSPAYNAGVAGATYSRHMYGDGFDLDPVSVGLATLEAACTDIGGMLVEYTTHVHCDFRFDDVSVEFYGPAPMASGVGAPLSLSADLVQDDNGTWTAPTQGFDEGEPRRRWQAFDAGGELLATGSGATFTPPAQARSLEVRVGRVLDLVVAL